MHPRFLVDGMLGSTAIKLRILGYDTLYDKDSSDHELLETARESGRILLTSDKELILRAKREKILSIGLNGTTEVERLSELFTKLGMRNVDFRGESRCASCNGILTARQIDRFRRQVYECKDCKERYWRGAHWDNLEVLFNSVNRSLLKNRLAAPSE